MPTDPRMTHEEAREIAQQWTMKVLGLETALSSMFINRLTDLLISQRRAGLQRAAEILREDPDNLWDWTDEMRAYADKFAQAIEREAEQGKAE